MMMRKLVVSVLCISMFFISCVKQMEEPESLKIAGTWAVVDDNNLTSKYVVFENGSYTEYMMSNKAYVNEKTVWGASKDDFKEGNQTMYSIIDGVLCYEGKEYTVKVQGDKMDLGESKCVRIDTFKPSRYSKISLADLNEYQFQFTEKEVEWKYTIENRVEAFPLILKECPDWIGSENAVQVTEDKISFHLPMTEVTRTGRFVFACETADDVELTITQDVAEIVLSSNTFNCNYASVTGSFGYQIPYRQDGQTLEVKSDSWIKTTDDGENINYTIAENNSGVRRTGKITLTYAGVSKDFIVTQTYEASIINLNVTSKTFDYTGGAFDISYSIKNPREGYSLSAKASKSWITDVIVSEGENKVSFVVPENNDGAKRNGNIVLTYGNVTATFSVIQNYSSSDLVLNASSKSCDYIGGDFDIPYSIINPREGYSLLVDTKESWITDIVVLGEKVSYKVSENNSGTSRSGVMTLSYGNIKKEFTVSQSYSAPDIVLSPLSASHTYKNDTYSFIYTLSNPREGQKIAISANESWITILQDKEGTVFYAIAENNSGASRTGVITLIYAGIEKRFTVIQAYSASSVSLSASEVLHGYRSGASGFKYDVLNPREGKSAVVSTSDAWITDIKDQDGQVSYSYAINKTGTKRTGKITVRYEGYSVDFRVVQDIPGLTLSTATAGFDYSSKSSSFVYTVVDRLSELQVEVKSDVAWITSIKDTDGTISYKVLENNSGSSRTGKISVSYAGVSKTVAVTQSYSPSTLSLSSSTNSHSYLKENGRSEYTLSNPRDGYSVNATTTDNWITDVLCSNGVVTYKVSVNDTGASRTGKISVTYPYLKLKQELSVVQAAASVMFVPASVNMTYTVGSSSFRYVIQDKLADLKVEISTDAAWITNIQDSNSSVSFAVTENNTGSARTGKIVLKYAGVSKEFVVTQAYLASAINLSRSSSDHDYLSGSNSFTYTLTNPREGSAVTAVTDDDWITNVVCTSSSVSYNVSLNASGQARTGKIYIKYPYLSQPVEFVVNQSAAEIDVQPSSSSVGYAAKSHSFGYNIPNQLSDFELKAASDVNWITGVAAAGGLVSYNVSENNTGASRTGHVTLSYAGVNKQVSITQTYTAPSIQLQPSGTITQTYNSGTGTISVTVSNPRQNEKVTASSSVSWIISSVSNDGSQVNYTYSQNVTGSSRTGQITVRYAGQSKSVSIVQSAVGLTLKSTSANIGYNTYSSSFAYVIANTDKSVKAEVTTDVDWIYGITDNSWTVGYKVKANNGGATRTGKIMVSYAGVKQTFTVKQTYSAPQITLQSASVSVPYAGGSYDVNCTITNPRNDETVLASADVSWITGVTVANNKLSFNVSENESKVRSRSGSISISYLGISKQVTVTQSAGITDISASGSANSYIISHYTGIYGFKAVKGNSSESVGEVASTKVLWESFGTSANPSVGSLIKSVSYEEEYIILQTADFYREGNAVVAALNSADEVLWSWHIWFTDPPASQTYHNNAGVMMDRNLGAISATMGDVGALGLLYQWGRKDPFIGSASITSAVNAGSSTTWPTPVARSTATGTIDYATSHPMTFITNDGGDWLSGSDNLRWTYESKEKSMYDPCPSGWRVPNGGDSGVWSTANKISGSSTDPTYSVQNAGINFSVFGVPATIWYPAPAIRSGRDGSLITPGSNVYYWSATNPGPAGYSDCLYFANDGWINTSSATNRSTGAPVRCIKE